MQTSTSSDTRSTVEGSNASSASSASSARRGVEEEKSRAGVGCRRAEEESAEVEAIVEEERARRVGAVAEAVVAGASVRAARRAAEREVLATRLAGLILESIVVVVEARARSDGLAFPHLISSFAAGIRTNPLARFPGPPSATSGAATSSLTHNHEKVEKLIRNCQSPSFESACHPVQRGLCNLRVRKRRASREAATSYTTLRPFRQHLTLTVPFLALLTRLPFFTETRCHPSRCCSDLNQREADVDGLEPRTERKQWQMHNCVRNFIQRHKTIKQHRYTRFKQEHPPHQKKARSTSFATPSQVRTSICKDRSETGQLQLHRKAKRRE